jgi:hypothetical protein
MPLVRRENDAVVSTIGLAEADQPGLLAWALDVAERGRRRLFWGMRARLLLMILIAISSLALAPLDGAVRWSALAAATGLLVAVFTEVALLQMRPERDWREGQMIADSVESLAWRFAVGGEPFPAPHLRAEELFLSELGEIGRAGRELGVGTAVSKPPITQAMRTLRAEPFQTRKAAYLENRLTQRQRQYAEKAGFHARRARRWRAFVLCSNALGVCAALLTALVWRTNVAGVAATVTTAAIAWLETRQHEALGESYGLAVRDLDLMKARVERADQESQWARLVDEAEKIVQQGWPGSRPGR